MLKTDDTVSDVLAEAMGLAQHHVAGTAAVIVAYARLRSLSFVQTRWWPCPVSGTEKQHVAYDYAKRLAIGQAACETLINTALASTTINGSTI